MGHLKRIKIGYVMTPGARTADIIGLNAVLGAHPQNKIEVISFSKGFVRGMYNFPIEIDSTFNSKKEFDVLVIGEQSRGYLNNSSLLDYIKHHASNAKYVIGVSNGVELLAKTGVLDGKRVTSDKKTLDTLKSYPLHTEDVDHTVIDGKFYTSGPCTGGIESALLVMKEIRGKSWTKFLEMTLEYDPKPLFSNQITDEYNEHSFSGNKALKVAVLTAPNMYTPDVIGAIDVLGRIPKTQFFYVWDKPGKTTGILNPNLISDCSFNKCPQVDVIIVGALSPGISANKTVNNFLIKQEPNAKAIISVCAGTFVVGGAGLLKGKRATTNFQMHKILTCIGVKPDHAPVVKSDKFYSAGPAIGSYESALMFVKETYGEECAYHIENRLLEYSPNPVFGVGNPIKAGIGMLRFSNILFAPLLPLYKYYAKKAYKRNKKAIYSAS